VRYAVRACLASAASTYSRANDRAIDLVGLHTSAGRYYTYDRRDGQRYFTTGRPGTTPTIAGIVEA
jgi:hypothetical protein